MNYDVSVIVPCYNCANSITKTMDSLSSQTLKNLEVIAINDGSTDNTQEILLAYQKSHPDFTLRIYEIENQGVANARNVGLQHVTGEYFGFLDADDYTSETMFADLYKTAKHENAQVVVSNFHWVNSKGEKLQKDGPYGLKQDMMVNLFAVLWNKLYRTEFIKSLDLSFPTGYRYEDAYFLYCLTMHVERIAFVDQAYVSYVQNESSITHTNNEEVKDMIEIFQRIVAYYKKHDAYEEYQQALEYLHIRFFLGNSFLRSTKIEDPKLRKETISMGWNLLNEEFPEWHKNTYLHSIRSMKNRYFKMVNQHTIWFFAWFFHHFKKDNL